MRGASRRRSARAAARASATPAASSTASGRPPAAMAAGAAAAATAASTRLRTTSARSSAPGTSGPKHAHGAPSCPSRSRAAPAASAASRTAAAGRPTAGRPSSARAVAASTAGRPSRRARRRRGRSVTRAASVAQPRRSASLPATAAASTMASAEARRRVMFGMGRREDIQARVRVRHVTTRSGRVPGPPTRGAARRFPAACYISLTDSSVRKGARGHGPPTADPRGRLSRDRTRRRAQPSHGRRGPRGGRVERPGALLRADPRGAPRGGLRLRQRARRGRAGGPADAGRLCRRPAGGRVAAGVRGRPGGARELGAVERALERGGARSRAAAARRGRLPPVAGDPRGAGARGRRRGRSRPQHGAAGGARRRAGVEGARRHPRAPSAPATCCARPSTASSARPSTRRRR